MYRKTFFKMAQQPVANSLWPRTVDYNITGQCQLRCAWCWGPDHTEKPEVTLDECKEGFKTLQARGTQNVTITGGEPLLVSWLPDLLQYLKSLQMRVTLSTNGILLKRKAKVTLPYVDDIGIPLDGPSPCIQELMRGSAAQFRVALNAIKLVQREYPQIELTIRTVVARQNLGFVPKIGLTLLEEGIDLDKIRWKLYQVNDAAGPRTKETKKGGWIISREEFDEEIIKTRAFNPQIKNIVAQPISNHNGRYFMMDQGGEAYLMRMDPYEPGAVVWEQFLGNALFSSDIVLRNLESCLEDYPYLENHHDHGLPFKNV